MADKKDPYTGKKYTPDTDREVGTMHRNRVVADDMTPGEQEKMISAGRKHMSQHGGKKISRSRNPRMFAVASPRASSAKQMMAQATGKKGIAPPSVLPTRKA